MYDTISQLRGVLNLKPTGLKGRGKLKFKVAEMTSNNFDFNTMTFVADTTNFDDDGWSLTNFKAKRRLQRKGNCLFYQTMALH
jgi:hypothetical protein